MSQHDIELILTQQLASYLALPIFIVDPEGNLLSYNEPAEQILGMRFDETGEMPAAEWGTIFRPTDADGHAIDVDDLPLVRCLTSRRPAHARLWIRSTKGKIRKLDIAAVPLVGLGDRLLGAAAIFSEAES